MTRCIDSSLSERVLVSLCGRWYSPASGTKMMSVLCVAIIAAHGDKILR